MTFSEIEKERIHKFIKQAIKKFDLNLKGLTVFTEAASGNYMYTSIAAALAGAKQVFAIAKDSRYGTKEEIKKQTIAEAKKLEVDNKIKIIFENNLADLSKCDIITNSGFVRPITKELIFHLKPTAVIPLMYETWEFRKEDLDLDSCRSHGILVLGTNEECPPMDIMRYSGFLASKLMFECKQEVHKDNILVIGSGRLGNNLAQFMQANKINFSWISLDNNIRKENKQYLSKIEIIRKNCLNLIQ